MQMRQSDAITDVGGSDE